MTKIDNLLHVIEEGDAVTILSEEELIKGINFLFQYELITVTEDKLLLTERGKAAKRESVRVIIEREELIIQEKSDPVDVKRNRKLAVLLSKFGLLLKQKQKQ